MNLPIPPLYLEDNIYTPLYLEDTPLYLEVTHAARFALKTTTAFNEESKKENLAWKAENRKIIAKNSQNLGKNGVIFAYICSQSTKSDIRVWEITRRHE